MDKLRASSLEQTPTPREILKQRLPVFLKKVSPRVAAWLIPMALNMGCAGAAKQIGADLQAQQEQVAHDHFISQRLAQINQNEITPSRTHTTPDGRTWTASDMMRYLRDQVGNEHVLQLLTIEHNDRLVRAMEPHPSEVANQQSNEPESPRLAHEQMPRPDRHLINELLREGYPTTWTAPEIVSSITYSRITVLPREDYGIATAHVAGVCEGGVGIEPSRIVIYQAGLYPHGGFQPSEFVRVQSHELGHAQSALTGELPVTERLERSFYSVRRVLEGRGLGGYVAGINSLTRTETILNRGNEVFAVDVETVLTAEERVLIHGLPFTPQHIREEIGLSLQVDPTTAGYIQSNMSRFMRLGTLAERQRRAQARIRFIEQLFNAEARTILREHMFARMHNATLQEVLRTEVGPALEYIDDALILEHNVFTRQGAASDLPLVQLTPLEQAALTRYRTRLQNTISELLTSVDTPPITRNGESVTTAWTDAIRGLSSVALALSGSPNQEQRHYAIRRFGERHLQWNEFTEVLLQHPRLLTPEVVSVLRRVSRALTSLDYVAAPEDIGVLRDIAQRARDLHHYAHSPL